MKRRTAALLCSTVLCLISYAAYTLLQTSSSQLLPWSDEQSIHAMEPEVAPVVNESVHGMLWARGNGTTLMSNTTTKIKPCAPFREGPCFRYVDCKTQRLRRRAGNDVLVLQGGWMDGVNVQTMCTALELAQLDTRFRTMNSWSGKLPQTPFRFHPVKNITRADGVSCPVAPVSPPLSHNVGFYLAWPPGLGPHGHINVWHAVHEVFIPIFETLTVVSGLDTPPQPPGFWVTGRRPLYFDREWDKDERFVTLKAKPAAIFSEFVNGPVVWLPDGQHSSEKFHFKALAIGNCESCSYVKGGTTTQFPSACNHIVWQYRSFFLRQVLSMPIDPNNDMVCAEEMECPRVLWITRTGDAEHKRIRNEGELLRVAAEVLAPCSQLNVVRMGSLPIRTQVQFFANTTLVIANRGAAGGWASMLRNGTHYISMSKPPWPNEDVGCPWCTFHHMTNIGPLYDPKDMIGHTPCPQNDVNWCDWDVHVDGFRTILQRALAAMMHARTRLPPCT